MTKLFAGQSLKWLTIEPHTLSSAALALWFEAETGAHIDITAVPYANITEKAILDVSSQTAEFDIVQYWYPTLGTLVQKDALKEITGWWQNNEAEIQPEDIIPVFRDTWCISGEKRFGVPYDGDMHLLFYNKVLFEKHALQPPQTWDEYLKTASQITQAESGNGIYGCGIMAANIPLILIGTFLNRLASFGGNFFDTQGSPTVNSPEAVAALEHLLAEMPYALPDPTHVAFEEMLGPWLAGRVGMVEFWADLGKMSDDPAQSVIVNQWGVVPLPIGPGPLARLAAPLNAGWSLGVSTRSNNPDLALEFLKFTLRPDIVLRISTIQGGLDPVRWSTYQLPDYRNCVTEELATAAKTAVTTGAVPWPTDASWLQLQDILNENLYQAVTGSKSSQQALEDTQAAWLRVLE